MLRMMVFLTASYYWPRLTPAAGVFRYLGSISNGFNMKHLLLQLRTAKYVLLKGSHHTFYMGHTVARSNTAAAAEEEREREKKRSCNVCRIARYETRVAEQLCLEKPVRPIVWELG